MGAGADRFDNLPGTPFLVLAGYVIAGLLVIPVTLLIAATGLVFGPVLGVVYALLGALTSALVTYGIGRRLGRPTVRRLAGPRLNSVSRKLAKRGLLAVVLVRIVPVAPYTIVWSLVTIMIDTSGRRACWGPSCSSTASSRRCASPGS